MTARFDLRDYIDERIGIRSRVAGGHGEELVCDCPFCGGGSKLYVNAGLGLWVCYRCGERGGTIRLVQEVDGLSRQEAIRLVVEASVRLPSRCVDELLDDAEPSAPGPESAEPEALKLPPEFVPIFDGSTWTLPPYLRERGIRARTAAAYGLGHCASGRYADRIILPAHVLGRLTFYQGRSTTGAVPKYLAPSVDRSSVLWGYDEAAGAERVFIVEGALDVLGCAQAGLTAVGLLGKVISTAQAALIAGAGFARATVMLDPEAGREGAAVARLLSDLIDADLARLPAGCDPGDASGEILRAAASTSSRPTLRDRFLVDC